MSETPSTHYSALLGAAKQIGFDCVEVNRAFVECKQVNDHPSKCLQQGEKVTACVLKVLRKAEDQCAKSFQAYQFCIEDNNRMLGECKKEEEAFNKCMSQ